MLNKVGAHLAAGIGGAFGSPLALLRRGVLGGSVGVEFELHHSCRILLEKLSVSSQSKYKVDAIVARVSVR